MKTVSLLLVALLAPVAFGQVKIIQNNSTTLDLAQETTYQIVLPAGVSSLSITVEPGNPDSGDCDLFVSHESLPSPGSYDFKSDHAGNHERIDIPNPPSGRWNILLHAYKIYLPVYLTVSYSTPTNTNVPVGGKLWESRLDSGSSLAGSPVVDSGGRIIVGAAKSIYALNPSGKIILVADFSTAEVTAAPALGSDGAVYVVSVDPTAGRGFLTSITPGFYLNWEFAQRVARHGVAISSDIIYVASDHNSLFAVNSDGSVRWEALVTSGFHACCPPVVGKDGTIFCGFSDGSSGKFYAIDPLGTIKWNFDVNHAMNSPAIDAQGNVIFGVPTPVGKLYSVSPAGQKQWEYSIDGGPAPYSDIYYVSPPVIGTDGSIYISSDRRLIAVSSKGLGKWHYDTGTLLPAFGVVNGAVVDANGVIYFGSAGIFGEGKIYAINPDGSLLWSSEIGSQIENSPLITPDGILLFGATDSRSVVAFKTSGTPGTSPWPSSRQNLKNTASVVSTNSIPPLPGLTITKVRSTTMKIGWPASAGAVVLEAAPTLAAPVAWNPISLPVTTNGVSNSVIISISNNVQLFRLRSP